jgi:hypothetical protein
MLTTDGIVKVATIAGKGEGLVKVQPGGATVTQLPNASCVAAIPRQFRVHGLPEDHHYRAG